MSVIAKFNKLFPNSKVWMIEPYISDKIPVVMFELMTNERSLNIYGIKDILTIRGMKPIGTKMYVKTLFKLHLFENLDTRPTICSPSR